MAKRLILIIVFLCMGLVSMAQKFEVPKDYAFQDEKDYEKYQPDVLKAIDWCQQTPYNEKRLQRSEISDFLMGWIEGCPYVVIETSDDINELGDNDYDLLVCYFGGYTKYLLQTKENPSKADARMAGIKALFAKYEKDKEFIHDKKVEKLMRLDKEGGLQAWLNNTLDD